MGEETPRASQSHERQGEPSTDNWHVSGAVSLRELLATWDA